MTMDAGREMDAAVAEKVMRQPLSLTIQRCLNQRWTIDVVPCYSTDIAAAWQVMERLRERSHLLILFQTPTYYQCVIEIKDRDDVTETAREAPLAICRAALAACDA